MEKTFRVLTALVFVTRIKTWKILTSPHFTLSTDTDRSEASGMSAGVSVYRVLSNVKQKLFCLKLDCCKPIKSLNEM